MKIVLNYLDRSMLMNNRGELGFKATLSFHEDSWRIQELNIPLYQTFIKRNVIPRLNKFYYNKDTISRMDKTGIKYILGGLDGSDLLGITIVND